MQVHTKRALKKNKDASIYAHLKGKWKDAIPAIQCGNIDRNVALHEMVMEMLDTTDKGFTDGEIKWLDIFAKSKYFSFKQENMIIEF